MIERVTATTEQVRKFGVLFGLIATAAGAFFAWKGNGVWPWFLGAAAFFIGTGVFAIPVLRPVYKAWMTFALILAWINTRILLTAFYFLVLTPIALVMRLMGKDFLDEKIDRSRTSYWIKREKDTRDMSRYERLF